MKQHEIDEAKASIARMMAAGRITVEAKPDVVKLSAEQREKELEKIAREKRVIAEARRKRALEQRQQAKAKREKARDARKEERKQERARKAKEKPKRVRKSVPMTEEAKRVLKEFRLANGRPRTEAQRLARNERGRRLSAKLREEFKKTPEYAALMKARAEAKANGRRGPALTRTPLTQEQRDRHNKTNRERKAAARAAFKKTPEYAAQLAAQTAKRKEGVRRRNQRFSEKKKAEWKAFNAFRGRDRFDRKTGQWIMLPGYEEKKTTLCQS